jgi:hypothetical protein
MGFFFVCLFFHDFAMVMEKSNIAVVVVVVVAAAAAAAAVVVVVVVNVLENYYIQLFLSNATS